MGSHINENEKHNKLEKKFFCSKIQKAPGRMIQGIQQPKVEKSMQQVQS